MASHINCTIEQPSEMDAWLETEKLKVELQFWKKRAQSLTNELENIPRALRDHGEWFITINGRTTHVILDPSHHSPPKDTQ